MVNEYSWGGPDGVEEYVEQCMEDADAPCFTVRVSTDDELDIRDIRRYLQIAKKSTATGVLMFSVNEREPNYKEWVKQGLSFRGATCTVGRSRKHGSYKCFLVSIPAEPRFTSYQDVFK